RPRPLQVSRHPRGLRHEHLRAGARGRDAEVEGAHQVEDLVGPPVARPRWSRPALLLPVSMLAAATLGAGCPVASSIRYTGASDAERKLLTQADRRVFPDDVRKDVDRFKKVTVAWTGIIRAIRPGPAPGTSELDIEHHYWDWIEDHSIQKAKAFLSQRGEGSF